MSIKATAELREGLVTRLTDERHVWTVDSDDPAVGGSDSGPDPEHLMVSALAGCIAITVKLYAQRKGWHVAGVDVTADLERYRKADYPAYTGDSDMLSEIRVSVAFHGDLTDEQRARLFEIAGKCPVHRILSQPIFIIDQLQPVETSA